MLNPPKNQEQRQRTSLALWLKSIIVLMLGVAGVAFITLLLIRLNRSLSLDKFREDESHNNGIVPFGRNFSTSRALAMFDKLTNEMEKIYKEGEASWLPRDTLEYPVIISEVQCSFDYLHQANPLHIVFQNKTQALNASLGCEIALKTDGEYNPGKILITFLPNRHTYLEYKNNKVTQVTVSQIEEMGNVRLILNSPFCDDLPPFQFSATYGNTESPVSTAKIVSCRGLPSVFRNNNMCEVVCTPRSDENDYFHIQNANCTVTCSCVWDYGIKGSDKKEGLLKAFCENNIGSYTVGLSSKTNFVVFDDSSIPPVPPKNVTLYLFHIEPEGKTRFLKNGESITSFDLETYDKKEIKLQIVDFNKHPVSFSMIVKNTLGDRSWELKFIFKSDSLGPLIFWLSLLGGSICCAGACFGYNRWKSGQCCNSQSEDRTPFLSSIFKNKISELKELFESRYSFWSDRNSHERAPFVQQHAAIYGSCLDELSGPGLFELGEVERSAP